MRDCVRDLMFEKLDVESVKKASICASSESRSDGSGNCCSDEESDGINRGDNSGGACFRDSHVFFSAFNLYLG